MKEFIAYYRAVYVGNVRNAKRGFWNVEILLIIISALLVAGVTACLNQSYVADGSGNFSGSIFIYASTFVYTMALSMGTMRRFKPSLMNLVPISYKKRAVYSHLSVMLYGVIFVLCWFAIMLAVILFISLLTLIFTGEWVFFPHFAENAGFAVYPDVQGVLFIVFLSVALFGVGMAISYIQNKKVRYSMLFVFPAVFFALALLLVNKSVEGKFVLCNNMLFNFINLPLSWVWLTAAAVIAVSVCAVSLALGFKAEKPKNY